MGVDPNIGGWRIMIRTSGRHFNSRIVVRLLCLVIVSTVVGCGWVPDPTLGLTTVNGNDAITTIGDGTDNGSIPVDQTPAPDAGADDPAIAEPGIAPSPDDSPEEGAASGNDMPQNVYCEAVAGWDAAWVAFEDRVLELVNQRRAEGADCGTGGIFEPAGPLIMNGALRCAARNHSMDMRERDYFDHYTPEGLGPADRLDDAGYSGSAWAENVAWGYWTPEAVVAGWMSSPGHCANLMRAHFTETGVGYYEGDLWTQTFGRP
jgi:uncharacterized protein YkwD